MIVICVFDDSFTSQDPFEDNEVGSFRQQDLKAASRTSFPSSLGSDFFSILVFLGFISGNVMEPHPSMIPRVISGQMFCM